MRLQGLVSIYDQKLDLKCTLKLGTIYEAI